MKILHHFRTRGVGAEAVHIAGVANALEVLGHKVVFSSPTGVDPRASAGVNLLQDSDRGGIVGFVSRKSPAAFFEILELGYNIVAWFRNRRLLHRERFDLIYERHAFFMFATALLAQRWRIPFDVEVNELVGDERVRKQPSFAALVRQCDRITFQRANLIVVVSPHLKRKIVAQGIDVQKILVLPNAVSREEFSIPADGGEWRKRWCCKESVVIAVRHHRDIHRRDVDRDFRVGHVTRENHLVRNAKTLRHRAQRLTQHPVPNQQQPNFRLQPD